MTKYSLGKVDSYTELDTRGFDLDPDDIQKRVLLVKCDGDFYCYRNSCPHTGAPLNWEGDRFLSLDKQFIQCSLHGAQFRITNGLCVLGPCPGQFLSPIRIDIVDEEIFIEL